MKPEALRRTVIGAQGYARRARSAEAKEVLAAIRRLSCVQLDSISAVERSHRIALATRVGRYDERAISRMLRAGKIFEYWAHEACLLPIEDWPLFQRRMRERGREHHWWGDVIGSDRALARSILRRVEREGPLKASDFQGRSGGMWDLKPEKRMLDALFTAGKLVVADRAGFQRVYDLPERVIPAKVLDAAPMSEAQTLRAMCLRAVRARGALTAAGVAEHYRIGGRAKTVQPHLDALVRAGEIQVAEVDEGRAVYLGDAKPATASSLLSPFDNLLWDRAFAKRTLGFDHVMEIYKRPHERKYGYYVLPFLHGDRIAARLDLKSERAEGALVVRALHWEPDARGEAAEDALAKALARLANAIGLATVRSS